MNAEIKEQVIDTLSKAVDALSYAVTIATDSTEWLRKALKTEDLCRKTIQQLQQEDTE